MISPVLAGSFLGTMSGDDMTFAMDMLTSSMMSAGCSSRSTGTAHVNRTTMTMNDTYLQFEFVLRDVYERPDGHDPPVRGPGVWQLG